MFHGSTFLNKKANTDAGRSLSAGEFREFEKLFCAFQKLKTSPEIDLIKKLTDYKKNLNRQQEEINNEFGEVQKIIQKIILTLEARSQSTDTFLANNQCYPTDTKFNFSKLLSYVEQLLIPSDVELDVDEIVKSSMYRDIGSPRNKLNELASKLTLKNFKNEFYLDQTPHSSSTTSIPSLDDDDDELWPMEMPRKNQSNRMPTKTRSPVVLRQKFAERSQTQTLAPITRQNSNSTEKRMVKFKPVISKSKMPINDEKFPVKAEVTHIVNLDEFYIRDLSVKEKEIKFLKSLQDFCNNSNSMRQIHPMKSFVGVICLEKVWYRVRVINVDGYNCTVYLLDFGRTEIVETSHFYTIQYIFLDQHEMAIKCHMVNVEPLDTYGYPQESLEIFRKFTSNNQYNIKIVTVDEEAVEDSNACIVYICGFKDRRKICFNSFLVIKDFAISSGNCPNVVEIEEDAEEEEACEEYMKVEPKNEFVTRVPVKILKAITPGEIYIMLESRVTELESLQNAIIDHPLNIVATKENLQMIRAHLYGMFPNTGKDSTWSNASIAKFNDYVKSFQKFAVSVFDAPENSISLPIILWGVEEKINFQHVEQRSYHNISYLMYDEGYADTKLKSDGESFLVKENLLDPKTLQIITPNEALVLSPSEICENLLQDQVNEQEDKIFLTDGIFMNFKPKKISKWIEAKGFEVGETFYGTAHYVNQDGVIFASSNQQMEVIKLMTSDITKFYDNQYVMPNNPCEVLKPGDCVICRYEDGCYYRAEVIRRSKTNPREYRVCYVDFGSFKNVNRVDIFNAVVAENIPLQVNRFVLCDVMPPADQQEWTPEILDFLHQSVVDPPIYVEVVEETRYPDVKGIQINLETSFGFIGYISDDLVNRGFARKRIKADNWPITFKNIDDSSNYRIDDMEELIESLQKLQQEMNDSQQPMRVPAIEFKEAVDVSANETKKYVKKMVSFNFNYELVHEYSVYSESSDSDSDKEKEVFTKNSKKRYRPVLPNKHAPKIDFRDFEDETFECIWHDIADPLNLIVIVEPIIPSNEALFNSTMMSINKMADLKLKHFKSAVKSIGRSCIVPTLKEGWMRGEVEKIDSEKEDIVHVHLIDKIEIIQINYQKIYRIDNNALKCPRKLLDIKLGVEKQLTRALAEKFNKKYKGKKVKIIVKDYDDLDMAIVEIDE